MKNVKKIVAGVLFTAAGLANAAGPVALSNTQMDTVSAGAVALATGAAASLGDFISSSSVDSITSTSALTGFHFALAAVTSKSIASSVFFTPAIAASTAAAVATLP